MIDHLQAMFSLWLAWGSASCKQHDREWFAGSAPAPDANVEAANDAVLFRGEVPMLYVWPQVVEPPQPAALAAPLQP
jgi:hypothetical protein